MLRVNPLVGRGSGGKMAGEIGGSCVGFEGMQRGRRIVGVAEARNLDPTL